MKIGNVIEKIAERFLELYTNSGERFNIEMLTYFLVFFTIVTTIDFLTGIIASKKKGIRIQSRGIGPSIGKIVSMILLYFLIILTLLVPGIGSLIRFPAYYAVFLLTLREVISIGENFGFIFNTKLNITIFLLTTYEILIGRFFKKIKNENTNGENSGFNNLPDE